MRTWIIPVYATSFDYGRALNEGHDTMDWRMSSHPFEVGDEVWLAVKDPIVRLAVQLEITAIGLTDEDANDHPELWRDLAAYYDGMGRFRYARMKVIGEAQSLYYSLEALQEHGLQGPLAGVVEVKDERLLHFIHGEESADTITEQDSTYEVDYPADANLYEGAVVQVLANRYERNRKAREQCVATKGTRCAVCGMDFQDKYGDIGRDFIHVHHLVPISSIGKEYELNVERDLVPVCPNCHYMLHRKNPPYTVEELRDKMYNNKQSAL